MAKKLDDLIASLPKEQQAAIHAEAERQIAEEMMLRELRNHFGFSQSDIAEELSVNQASVSKIESRVDMYISTLRDYIEAMGGRLSLIADFPGYSPVRLNQFDRVDGADGTH